MLKHPVFEDSREGLFILLYYSFSARKRASSPESVWFILPWRMRKRITWLQQEEKKGREGRDGRVEADGQTQQLHTFPSSLDKMKENTPRVQRGAGPGDKDVISLARACVVGGM